MKITLHEGLEIPETEIEIRCHTVDKRLSRLINTIRQYAYTLEERLDNASYYIPLENIAYVDSVDGHTFLYCSQKVYENSDTLSALEEKLRHTSFVRISKNCILNTTWLKSVAPLWNHRLEAQRKLTG